MKKIFLSVLSCFVITLIYSQSIVKEHYTTEHYTVSGGLLGAANFSEFRKPDNNPLAIDYSTKVGYAGGAWLNFPLSKGFSIEPQALYSSYRYFTNNNASAIILKDGSIRYISVPLLLKFHAGDHFAITAGPQVDFTAHVNNKNGSTAQESDFKQTSFSVFGGLEIFPHGPVTIFGRYIYGLTDMNKLSDENGVTEFKNQNIQAGLKFKLFGNKPKAYKATSTPIVLDTDGDGIPDDADKCPNEPGIAKYNGCPIPDSDKDGINDEEDKCPNEPGIAKYNGCPIPDSDKDGINDEEDKCPNEAGPASNKGCPILDRDGDGVNDDVDKCPDVAGPASNNGCPEVPQVSSQVNKMVSSTGNISFSEGSTKLSVKSGASLNNIIKIMKDDTKLKLKLEGHADKAEKDEDMKISEGRASAVKTYLVSKGISEDRITVEGFGGTMPIGDNAKNRRVELKVTY
jgi:outer membrane protein OmpA-like peptidoglycan-associated protein